MTIQDALQTAGHTLRSIEEANAIIYSLLSFSTGFSKEYIWAHPDIKITQTQLTRFLSNLDRAAAHEPLAYIIGEKEFYHLPFFVTQDVLIPRPESEKIIDISMAFLSTITPRPHYRPIVIDVGTGSGCLGITLATLFPSITIYAIDLSSKALGVARRNANRHSVSNIILLQGSLLEPLQTVKPHLQPDLIVANLPYISDDEFEALPANVKHFEPELALRSGADPDRLNRQLLGQAPSWLSPGGKLIYETTNGRTVELDAVDLI